MIFNSKPNVTTPPILSFSKRHDATLHSHPVAVDPQGTAHQMGLFESRAHSSRCRDRFLHRDILRLDRTDQCSHLDNGILPAEHLLEEGAQGHRDPPPATPAHAWSPGSVHVFASLALHRLQSRDNTIAIVQWRWKQWQLQDTRSITLRWHPELAAEHHRIQCHVYGHPVDLFRVECIQKDLCNRRLLVYTRKSGDRS